MDIKQLKYFVAVVDNGGFRAASEKLHITQPAISTAVAKLEDRLGTKILDRLPRHIVPTKEGAVLYDHAISILAHVARTENDMLALGQLRQGTVRVGSTAMIAPCIPPEHFLSFMDRHKGVTVDAKHLASKDLEAALVAGEIDLAITAKSDWGPAFSVCPLYTDEYVACLSDTHPLSSKKRLDWNEIFNQPLALFGPAHYLRQHLENTARDLGQELQVELQTDSLDFLLEACRKTKMVSVFLQTALRDSKNIHVLPIHHSPEIAVSVVWRKTASPSIAASAFIEYLRSNYTPR